jgi:tetratricopeptide (TPR) repeat protein
MSARGRTVAIGLLALVCAQGAAAAQRHKTPPAQKHAQVMSSTIENTDKRLAAALLKLKLLPSAAQHRAAADEYLRLGILDAAYDHLSAAIRLDPQDAAAYDARARIWRMWGAPRLGMGDAVRAVYFAPHSAAAHNTLGTLLAANGQPDAARREFRAALSLDPSASYARENLDRLDGVVAGDARSTSSASRPTANGPRER